MKDLDSMFQEPTDVNSMFEEEAVAKEEAPNRSLNNNTASYTALLKGGTEDFSANHREIMAEYDMLGYSPTAEQLEDTERTDAYLADKQNLTDIITDVELEDDIKLAAIQASLDLSNERYTLRNDYSTKILSKDSEYPNDKDNEFVRIKSAEIIDEVNYYNNQLLGHLATEVAKSDPAIRSKVADFAQLFVPFMEQAMVNSIDKEDENWPFLLMGSAKADIAATLRKMPPEDRLSAAKAYADIVNSNSSLFSDDQNDVVRMGMLSNAFDTHSYTSEDEFIDDFISVLEIGGLFSAPIKGVLNAATKLTRTAKARFIRAGKSPVSPIENATQFNQKEAKGMHNAILADETDDTAQALAGTTREQYLADAELPQVHDPDGIVTANTVDPNLQRIVEKDGAIVWSDEAKSQARLKVSNDFIRASSADIRANMSSVSNADDGMTFHAVYGPAENGWKSPQDAIETMAYNLRDFGVDESSFKILGKQADGTYRPVTLEELDAMATIRYTMKKTKSKQSRAVRVATKEPADYLIQIDHKHKFNPLNITDPKNMEARFNVFDRVKNFMGSNYTGSISRNLLDPMSLINKSITQGASVAVDKSSAIERVVLDLAVDLFAKPFNKMKPEKQDQLYDIIKRQNKEQRVLTHQELIAEGLNGEEIKTLQGFKTVQDNLYYLENRDLAITLRNQGNRVLVDKLGTKLIGKERQRVDIDMGKAITYDADSGKMLDKSTFDSVKHYDDGGTIVELRRPQKIDDHMVTHVVTRNKPSGSYTRAIADNETVLNYRAGYYKVKYDAPIFITKQVLDDSGNVLYVKAIGTAQSTKEAKMLVAKKQAADDTTWNNSGVQESIYRFRDDIKDDPSMNPQDMEMDLAMSGGRSSQRYRGERLEDSNEAIDTTAQHIAGPVDAMVQAARGLSSRTSMRPYIDGVKSRFVEAYKTELMKDRFGKVQFPKNMEQLEVMLKNRGEDASKLGADMRANFEYINYLENGYRNALDEAWKGAFNVLAKWMGKKSASAERAGYWMADNTAPTQLGKNIAFNLYLGLNPLRQIIVQGHQSIQLAAIHPKYFATNLGSDWAKMTAMRMGASSETASRLNVITNADTRTPQQVKALYQEYMDSGIPSAIDKQSLVAGNLTEATEYAQYTKSRSLVGKVGKAGAAVLRGARKIGFDVGEDINMGTAWLTMRNAKAEKVGRFELTPKELEEVAAEARNFTFNMNAAGDMPYNQTFLSIPMQFLQVPHKAATQLLANNALTVQQKVQVAAYSTFMYAPAGVVLSQWLGDDFFEGVPDPVRTIIEDGAESAALNGFFSSISGDDVDVDWSSLAPYDAGLLGFTTALFNTELAAFYTESPSGQLIADNGRVNQLAKSVGSLINPYDKHETSQDLLNTVQAFLKLSSGYSNVAKAEYAIRTGQALSSRGDVIDSDVSRLEGMFIAAGFPTKDSSWKYKTTMLKADRMKSIKEDAKVFYDNIRTHLVNQGVTNKSHDFARRAIAEGSMYEGEDREAFLEQVQSLIKRDAQANDFGVLRYIQDDAGIVSYEEQLQAIENMPNISDARKEVLKNRVRILNNWKTEGNK